MFKSYFKIAWRNLSKQKALSFISVFGLAAGIACFCLSMLYALNEFSFDRFHKNTDNIYLLLNCNDKAAKNDFSEWVFTSMLVGPTMKQDLCRIMRIGSILNGGFSQLQVY
jgi:putative ABC transport system permease protein